jgi:Ca2+/Na+ antiporter
MSDMSPLIMIASAAAIIFFVKFGLLHGIDQIANAMSWTAKARGQVTGYATSVPELVCLVSAGLAGVWEAGLWNIASSNIINSGLMLCAVLFYRQFNELLNVRFIDEIGFAALAVLVPILLMHFGMDQQWYLVPILFGFFLIYRFVDRRVNRADPVADVDPDTDEAAAGSLPFGIIIGISALIAIAIAGMFLGEATASVVDQMGVSPEIAGWILGVVTSIPELVSFFAIYAASKRAGKSQSLNDTQEALDNLTGSNMANVSIVYPFGLTAYLLAQLLFAN